MKDQFRSRRVALWLNLIPDLVRSGELEAAAKMEGLGEEEDATPTTVPGNALVVDPKLPFRPLTMTTGDRVEPTAAPINRRSAPTSSSTNCTTNLAPRGSFIFNQSGVARLLRTLTS